MAEKTSSGVWSKWAEYWNNIFCCFSLFPFLPINFGFHWLLSYSYWIFVIWLFQYASNVFFNIWFMFYTFHFTSFNMLTVWNLLPTKIFRFVSEWVSVCYVYTVYASINIKVCEMEYKETEHWCSGLLVLYLIFLFRHCTVVHCTAYICFSKIFFRFSHFFLSFSFSFYIVWSFVFGPISVNRKHQMRKFIDCNIY